MNSSGIVYPRINMVENHPIREFSALTLDSGIVLCDKEQGSFLVLRYREDLENLKTLLNKIEVVSSYESENCPSCNGLGYGYEVLDEELRVTCPDRAGSGNASGSITKGLKED
jgi:hypothetical protein